MHAHPLAAVHHVHVVPELEALGDRAVRLGVGLLQEREGLAREDDAPAVGVVAAVALEEAYLVARVLLLHQEGEVEPGGAAADDRDPHGGSL